MTETSFRETSCRIPMNIQFFAESGGDGGTGRGQQGTQNQDQGQNGQGSGQQGQPSGQQAGQPPAIDYAKIQQMLDGTLAAKEETALKAYFRQQGLSQQEAEQAMAAFRQQKAASQPDVAGLQTQVAQAQAEARKAQLEQAATLAAVGLGLDAKSIPYVLRMADFSQAVGQDGTVSGDAVKSAVSKVLEDVPALKPQAGGSGFIRVGADGGGNPGTGAAPSLREAISAALKK